MVRVRGGEGGRGRERDGEDVRTGDQGMGGKECEEL